MTIYSLDVLLFPIWNHSIVPCLVLTVASWSTYRFLRMQVRWSGIPISLRIFQFVVIHAVKGFSIVNEAEVDASQEFSFFLYNPMNVGIFTSGFSAFSKHRLYVWKFLVCVLLKPSLKDFEHYFASIWKGCNFTVVRTFLGIVLLWDWNENWPFSVLWSLLSFSNLLTYWV